MSEAELHVLYARMRGGALHKARCGELIIPLPAGLVYDSQGRVIPDPALPEHSCTAGIKAGRSQTGVDDARTRCGKSSSARFLGMPIQATSPGKISKKTFAV
ncbi:MAG: hypothetical protein HUU41_07150 [Bryobacteraceae bacterium]|nr:hypothetical protein [Bryobacterales bacterium]NUN00873.1 hypothetical protein [Bryobacteraceae bacterium]